MSPMEVHKLLQSVLYAQAFRLSWSCAFLCRSLQVGFCFLFWFENGARFWKAPRRDDTMMGPPVGLAMLGSHCVLGSLLTPSRMGQGKPTERRGPSAWDGVSAKTKFAS